MLSIHVFHGYIAWRPLNEIGNMLPLLHCYTFQLAARDLLYAPSHRQNNTYHSLCYISCGALVGMRNSTKYQAIISV